MASKDGPSFLVNNALKMKILIVSNSHLGDFNLSLEFVRRFEAFSLIFTQFFGLHLVEPFGQFYLSLWYIF